MTFKPGMYAGNDHGAATDPYFGYTDNADAWLTGTTSFAPGEFAMQYAGPNYFESGFEFWGSNRTAFLARAYSWCTSHANRKIVLRTAPGFSGAQGGGGPVGKAGYDSVANGSFTSTTQAMVNSLYAAGPAPGLLPYTIVEPWWESAAYWFNWCFSNTGVAGVGPAGTGDWRASALAAWIKYIDDAKAQETVLTGVAPVLQFGFGFNGDNEAVLLCGYPQVTAGPTGTGIYPGDSRINYITGDMYSNNSRWATYLPDMRNFAQTHGKKLVTPEFGWMRLATSEANDLAFLQAYYAEVAAHPVWEGFIHFNTNAPDGDSQIYNPFSPTTPTALATAKPNALAYFKSQFGVPLNQAGTVTSSLSNVTYTQIGASTVRVAGNCTNDILNVVVYTDNTHAVKLGEVAPSAGAFPVDIPNVAAGGPYPWDVAGWNVPAGSAGPPTPAIVATFGLSVTVTATPTIVLGTPSTSGTQRTIPFTVTGPILNVTAYEPPFAKTAGTNDVAPVAGAGTIVVTGETNGAHTVTLYGWSKPVGDPTAVVLATVTDTFTIAAQPTPDDFDATVLNTVLWTLSKPFGDSSTATVSGGELVLAIPQVDVTDNTTRGDNASISVGSAFTGGYTLIGAGSATLASNAIHDTNTAGVDTIYRIEQDLGTPDMSVEVQLALWGTSGASTVAYGVAARMGTGATPDYYLAIIAPIAGPLWDVYLSKKVGGVSTALASTVATGHITAPAVGGTSSKLRLEVVGNKITTYLDDAVIIPTVTDSAITNGNFGGIFMNRSIPGVDVSVKAPRVASYWHGDFTLDRSVGVEQTVADSDFPAHEIRFRVPTVSLTGTGIQYRNSSTGDRVVFYVYTDNTGYHVIATTVTGGVATNFPGSTAVVFPQVDGLLQVSRVGNVWSFWTAATDGTSRVFHGQFTFAMTVDRIKVLAINQPAA